MTVHLRFRSNRHPLCSPAGVGAGPVVATARGHVTCAACRKADPASHILRDSEALTVDDLVSMFGVDRATPRTWVTSGRLPSFKRGQRHEFRRADVEVFAADYRTKSAA